MVTCRYAAFDPPEQLPNDVAVETVTVVGQSTVELFISLAVI